MQVLEWSIFGLRSARRTFRHADRDLVVTLFPMVHLAEPAFFDRVHDDASGHDVVIVEGIDSPVTRRLTRAYRWAAAGRLGLVAQGRYPRERARTIHADLSPEAFERLWRSAPRRERYFLEAGAAVYGLWLRVAGTRAAIGRALDTTDLPDRDAILMWSERTAPLLDALLDARDAVLCRTLRGVLDEAKPPRSVAVVYGAGHMEALGRCLGEAGFRPAESEWIGVFGP
jgi:hypothetical protein